MEAFGTRCIPNPAAIAGDAAFIRGKLTLEGISEEREAEVRSWREELSAVGSRLQLLRSQPPDGEWHEQELTMLDVQRQRLIW